MDLVIYAAGEIHSEWRDELRAALGELGVEHEIVGPQEVHDRSDDVGEDILGEQPNARYRDLQGARVNTLRTRVLMQRADMCVAYFGPKYKQWNAAFDAGYAAALGKSVIVLSPPEHQHALKEVHAAALAVAEEPRQVVEILRYVLTGKLPG